MLFNSNRQDLRSTGGSGTAMTKSPIYRENLLRGNAAAM
jgi:hypothetical protein